MTRVLNYDDWNTALVEFFTSGAPEGSTIYLDVSERNLALIGKQFWPDVGDTDWTADYLRAVRERINGREQSPLETLRRSNRGGRPLGVAFLGVLVLVATQMDNDEDQQLSERDYFTRLNDALGTEPINQQVRRPKIMKKGADAEVPLWLAWAAYLRQRGYLPTAAGGAGAWRYIGYAVSQTLVRPPERRRLFRIFEGKGWPPDTDTEVLVAALKREDSLPAHLRRLLERTGLAAEDVHHAIGDTFLEWLDVRDGAEAGKTFRTSRLLRAGLFRGSHWRTGEASYALYPKQLRNQRETRLTVRIVDQTTVLRPERPGYFAPVGQVGRHEIENGARYPVLEQPDVEALVLPKRDFWILKQDPDAPGCFGSFGRPSVGEHFMLLVCARLAPDVEALKEQGLLQTQPPRTPFEGWIEYPAAMVIANFWRDATSVSSQLKDELAPTAGIALSVTGGLRVPRTGSWLAAAPPTVRVESFYQNARLTVLRDGEEIFSESVEQGETVQVPWTLPGTYELEAEVRQETALRIVNLLDWPALPEPDWSDLGREHVALARGSRLVGPWLREADGPC